jgi:hypothetical protein
MVNRAAADPLFPVRRWRLGTADADWVDRAWRKAKRYHIGEQQQQTI